VTRLRGRLWRRRCSSAPTPPRSAWPWWKSCWPFARRIAPRPLPATSSNQGPTPRPTPRWVGPCWPWTATAMPSGRSARRFDCSAHLYTELFAMDPKQAEALTRGHRYSAACSAVQAAAGAGRDATPLGSAERTRWRRQALNWLRADLKALDEYGAGRQADT